ncbi:MAG: class I SAM-dependent methyltransferase [Janthinobacterium lividum]
MSHRIDIDKVNQAAWNSRDAARWYAKSTTWSDPGEQAALEWVKPQCLGQPILDIGIGGGRTVPLLSVISSDYVGIDYTPKLLAHSKKRFPQADLRHMDARDMSTLPSNHFALVMFSYNGIDSVGFEDRLAILREMNRVLRPGGYLLFSSHNRNGPGYRESIWRLLPRFTLNPIKLAGRSVRSLLGFPIGLYNYLRYSGSTQDFDGYSIGNSAAHNFGIVIVYTTLANQRRELERLGLELKAVFGSEDGQEIAANGDADAWWLHYVAYKPVRT